MSARASDAADRARRVPKFKECLDLPGDPLTSPRGLPVALSQRAEPLLTEYAVLVDQERRRQSPHSVAARDPAVLVQQHGQSEAQLGAEGVDRTRVFLEVNRLQVELLP